MSFALFEFIDMCKIAAKVPKYGRTFGAGSGAMKSEDLYRLIEAKRGMLGISQNEVGRRAFGSAKNNAIQSLRRGNSPTAETLSALCDALDLEFYIGPPREGGDSAAIVQITPDKRDVVDGQETGLVSLPRYDIEASAGHGALAHDDAVVDYLTVSRQWLSRYVSGTAQVVVIEARGDSMEPTVRHGDLLIVEMAADNDTLAAGGVFILSVAGMIMIKRLQIMLDGDLRILSDNAAYSAQTVAADERDDKVIIHGRVVWSGGPMTGRR